MMSIRCFFLYIPESGSRIQDRKYNLEQKSFTSWRTIPQKWIRNFDVVERSFVKLEKI